VLRKQQFTVNDVYHVHNKKTRGYRVCSSGYADQVYGLVEEEEGLQGWYCQRGSHTGSIIAPKKQ
jgi:hypothetical protein